MESEPTITDEELVKWEVAWRALAEPPPVMRLIAALRAERARVKELERQLEDAKAEIGNLIYERCRRNDW